MNEQQRAHRERVLGHLEREPDAQWPLGTAPVVLDAAKRTKQNAVDLLAMLRRTTNCLASVGLLDVNADVKASALATLHEARALIRRVEGGK